MIIRVRSGIISDQMLSGGLRFFKLSSAALGHFANTTSDGGIVIPESAAGSTKGITLFQTIGGQDETLWNNSPTTEGTFSGGTGYSSGEIITMNDGTLVRVDAPAGPATVTGFTIIRSSTSGFSTTTTLTTTTGNANFTLTTDVDNEIVFVRDFYVSSGKAVPNSVADRIFRELSSKATIVILNVIDNNNIHFACDDSGFGWDSPAAGDAAAEMLIAIKALGPNTDGVIGSGLALSNDPPIPDLTQNGASSVDLNVGDVTLTETTPFELT